MDFFLSRPMLLLAVASATLNAPAQDKIIFSKPADVPAEKTKSFVPTITYHAGDFNAPHQVFSHSSADLPMPPPAQRNNDNASVREALDKRKNWTLLTPEQILGIQTPEQILGIPEKDSDKNLSLEEKFLNRQSRPASGSATNGRAGGPMWNPADAANPFVLKTKADADTPFRQASQDMEPGRKFFNQVGNGSGQANGPDEKHGLSWNSVFAQPPRPKPTPEQQAAMESFRALLQPNPLPDKSPVAARFTLAPAPTPDPFLQARPVENPAGRDVTPLNKLFSQPTGIQPLPGISTPPPTPINVRPKWQAQLPPWMNSGSQAQKPNRAY